MVGPVPPPLWIPAPDRSPGHAFDRRNDDVVDLLSIFIAMTEAPVTCEHASDDFAARTDRIGITQERLKQG